MSVSSASCRSAAFQDSAYPKGTTGSGRSQAQNESAPAPGTQHLQGVGQLDKGSTGRRALTSQTGSSGSSSVIGSPRTAFAAVIVLVAAAQPATAQWTRVTEVPIVIVFSVRVNVDTITAGGDTAAYVSTNAGVTWKRSAKITPGV